MSNRPGICWKCVHREDCKMFKKNPEAEVTKCGRFLMKDRESFLPWKCEHCGKLIPYPYNFCSECAEKLLGEAPKPFDQQESVVDYPYFIREDGRRIRMR